jgi:hypothetical protein
MFTRATLGLFAILVVVSGALADTKTQNHHKSTGTATSTTVAASSPAGTRQPRDPVGHPVPGIPHGHAGPGRYESY